MRRPMDPDTDHQERLSDNLQVENHGTEFYLVSTGQGHDLTVSLERDVAQRLAQFILRGRSAPVNAVDGHMKFGRDQRTEGFNAID